MKLFKTFQKLSCILMGMGMVVSAHAIDIFTCPNFFEPLNINGETYDLQNDIQCSAGQQIEITGNDITFNLNGFNIEQAGSSDAIIITGDGNQVNGPGEIINFPSSVLIVNANNNRVRKLDINGIDDAAVGVIISAINGTANRNIISNNVIRNLNQTGILLQGVLTGEINENILYNNDINNVIGQNAAYGIRLVSQSISTIDMNNNFIYHNNIEKITGQLGGESYGILLRNASDGTMNNNRVESNKIKDVSGGLDQDGIALQSQASQFSGDIANVDVNSVFENEISNVARHGISLVSTSSATNTTNQNIIFKNRITDTGAAAIALDPGADIGSVALNSISFNSTDSSPIPRYCDSSSVFNNWGINSRGLLLPPLFGTPVAC